MKSGNLLPNNNAPMKLNGKGPLVVQLLVKNRFDLDVGQCDPRSNRGHQLSKTMHLFSLRTMTHGLSSYLSEIVLIYKVNVTLTFETSTPNSKKIIYCQRPMLLKSLRINGPWVIE
jgi:hypothetical protein